MSKPKRVRPAMMPKSQYASYPKEFILEIIEIYRNNPCLWNKESEEYFDRAKKDRAYNKIIDKLQEVESFPDRKMAIEFFSALRFNYRKELKLVEEGMEPTLWYFKHLDFIRNFLYANRKNSWGIIVNDLNKTGSPVHNDKSTKPSTQSSFMSENQHQDALIELESSAFSNVELSSSPVPNYEQSSNFCQEYEEEPTSEAFQQSSEQYFDELAITWANILKSIPTQQQIIAEKLVNDVIYEAHNRKLSEQTQIDVLNILQS